MFNIFAGSGNSFSGHILVTLAYLSFVFLLKSAVSSSSLYAIPFLTAVFILRREMMFLVSIMNERFTIGFLGLLINVGLLARDIALNHYQLNAYVLNSGLAHSLLILLSLMIILSIDSTNGGVNRRGEKIFNMIATFYSAALIYIYGMASTLHN
jgi:hypothetical protein